MKNAFQSSVHVLRPRAVSEKSKVSAGPVAALELSVKNWLWRATLALLILVLPAGAFAQTKAPVPGNGGTVGGFEVDAHFQSGTIPAFWSSTNYLNFPTLAADWSGTNGVLLKNGEVFVPGTSADKGTAWKIDGNSGNRSRYREEDVFAGTSNKNSDFIGTSQAPWSVKAADGGPQKNDITNVFLRVQEVAGKKWLFFAFETRSTDGTSYADLEYNQAGLSQSLRPGSIVGLGLPSAGGRTVGDFILSVDFSGGGNNPSVAARTLNADGTWSAKKSLITDPAFAGKAFVTVNIADVPAVVSGAAFNGDGSGSNTTVAFQLIEGGINLTDTGLLPANPCSPAATMLFKTRSSDSFTAELKDLSLLPFAITPPATVAAVGDEKCVGATAELTATGTGAGVSAASFAWFAPGRSTPITSSATGRFAIATSYNATTAVLTSTLTITGLLGTDATTATSKYTAVMTGSTCDGPPATAALIVNPLPVVAVDDVTKCLGLDAIFQASPNDASVYSYQWFKNDVIISGAIASSYPVLAASAVNGDNYKAVVTNKTTTCSANDFGTLILTPLTPLFPEDATVCQGGSVVLVVTDEPKGGVWTGDGVTVLDGVYKFTSAGTTLDAGAYKVLYSFTGDDVTTCSNSKEATVTVTKRPAGPKVAYIPPGCSEDVFKIQIVAPEFGTIYTLNPGTTTEKSFTGEYVVDSNPRIVKAIIFEKIPAGAGFSVTARIGDCISDVTDCNNYLNAQRQSGAAANGAAPVITQPIQTEAYPNPTNKDATILFSVPVSGHVLVNVYDALGRRVTTLFDGEAVAGEQRTVRLKGADLPSGNYYYRVIANGQTKTNRISLTK